MAEMEIFTFEQKEVRTVVENNEVWFVAKDVCDVLELIDVSMTVKRLDEDEKDTKIICTLGGNQNMSVVNESGLYSLVLTSNKPQAKKFKKWITSEVIPSIRKTGSYSMMSPEEMALQVISYLQNKVEEQKQKIEILAPKALVYDETMKIENLMTIREVSKLAKAGSGIFWSWLKTTKIVYKENGINLPYQPYIEKGWFEVKWKTRYIGEKELNYPQIYVTSKGAAKLIEKWNKDNFELALI
jgi:prophage antirepressor-like protein